MSIKKLVFIFLFTITPHPLFSKQLRLYSICTPSHEILKNEWFLPSIQDDFEIIIKQYDQLCPSGQFNDTGWLDIMLKKVELIICAIKENWGEI